MGCYLWTLNHKLAIRVVEHAIVCSDIDMYPWNDLQFIGPGVFFRRHACSVIIARQSRASTHLGTVNTYNSYLNESRHIYG